MKSRLLSLCMAFILTMGCLGMAASAEEEGVPVTGAGQQETLNGWVTKSGHTYYYKNGKMAVKPTKIDKKLYMFQTNGILKKKKGLYTYNGKEYLGKGDGTLKTGWQIVKKKYACFFSKSNGSMYKNRYYKHCKLPKNGRLGKAYVQGIKFMNKYGWTLKKAFKHSVWLTNYAYHDMRRNSVEAYAKYGFSKHKGNCFVFASQFYICARLLGYNVTQWDGYVVSRDNPHSWCSIEYADGSVLIYDSSFADKNGISKGFGFKEGTKGTWRYMKTYRTPVKSTTR